MREVARNKVFYNIDMTSSVGFRVKSAVATHFRINAAKHFVKGKGQNQLTEKHIAKIIETYQFRKEALRYARRVGMKEIGEMTTT